MSLILQAEACFLLLVAALLSALVGLDREHGDQAAGLRTHMTTILPLPRFQPVLVGSTNVHTSMSARPSLDS
jgi:hypothetical protein